MEEKKKKNKKAKSSRECKEILCIHKRERKRGENCPLAYLDEKNKYVHPNVHELHSTMNQLNNCYCPHPLDPLAQALKWKEDWNKFHGCSSSSSSCTLIRRRFLGEEDEDEEEGRRRSSYWKWSRNARLKCASLYFFALFLFFITFWVIRFNFIHC